MPFYIKLCSYIRVFIIFCNSFFLSTSILYYSTFLYSTNTIHNINKSCSFHRKYLLNESQQIWMQLQYTNIFIWNIYIRSTLKCKEKFNCQNLFVLENNPCISIGAEILLAAEKPALAIFALKSRSNVTFFFFARISVIHFVHYCDTHTLDLCIIWVDVEFCEINTQHQFT